MSEVSDDMLMAYADGELRGEDDARIAAYVARSPEAARKVAVFKTTGKQLAGLFDQPMQEPVPQRLIDAIMRPENMGAQGDGHAKVIPFTTARRARSVVSQPGWMLAAACVTALIVGPGVAKLLKQQAVGGGPDFAVLDQGPGKRVASTSLATVLDSTSSGAMTVADISGTAAAIKPVFTFASANGGFCRQYVIERAGSESLAGVACREGAGQWRIETQVPFGPKPAPSDAIKTAGKEAPPEIDATVDRLIEGDVLSNDGEAELLKGGWKTPVR